MPFITQNLVNDFASHIRLYRRASDKVNTDQNNGNFGLLSMIFLSSTSNLLGCVRLYIPFSSCLFAEDRIGRDH